jgi:excisionase family DNA binding protein
MSSSLEINGTELQTIRAAAERTGYSRDYITRLAREEKIVASQIGRQWFVDLDSLKNYAAAVADELNTRKQQLSEERRRERLAVEKNTPRSSVSVHSQSKKSLSLSSQVLSLGVLFIGLGFGFLLNQMPMLSSGFSTQVASTPMLQSLQGHDFVETGTQEVSGAGVNFSHESVGLSTMEGASEGILLLPQVSGSSTNPAELFSDDVKIMVDADGKEFVARVNERGQVVEKIPFVVVPVTSEKTP